VEILTSYSHTAQVADLRFSTLRPAPVPCAPKPRAKCPQSLRDRLGNRDITDLIIAYRTGATAVSLATTHGLSFRSVKRLLRAILGLALEHQRHPTLTHLTRVVDAEKPIQAR
jgi:hypothetical protein